MKTVRLPVARLNSIRTVTAFALVVFFCTALTLSPQSRSAIAASCVEIADSYNTDVIVLQRLDELSSYTPKAADSRRRLLDELQDDMRDFRECTGESSHAAVIVAWYSYYDSWKNERVQYTSLAKCRTFYHLLRTVSLAAIYADLHKDTASKPMFDDLHHVVTLLQTNGAKLGMTLPDWTAPVDAVQKYADKYLGFQKVGLAEHPDCY